MKNYMIAIIVLVLITLGLSIFQSIQISSIKNNLGNGVTGNAAVDTSGWTEQEKMMYEHHGTLPSRVKGSQNTQNPSSGMVGGC